MQLLALILSLLGLRCIRTIVTIVSLVTCVTPVSLSLLWVEFLSLIKNLDSLLINNLTTLNSLDITSLAVVASTEISHHNNIVWLCFESLLEALDCIG